jgi:hypothetical protein
MSSTERDFRKTMNLFAPKQNRSPYKKRNADELAKTTTSQFITESPQRRKKKRIFTNGQGVGREDSSRLSME